MKFSKYWVWLFISLILNSCNDNSYSLIDIDQIPDKKTLINTHILNKTYSEEIEEARKLLFPLLKQFPGLSISVGYKDSIIWSEGIGYQDLSKKQIVSNETRFRLYSLSKYITATIAMKLISQDILDPEKSARFYLPSIPEKYDQVLVSHLIGHLSGIRHYKKGGWLEISQKNSISLTKDLDNFIYDDFSNIPGSTFKYSSFGYTLLSAILVSSSSKSFEELLNEIQTSESFIALEDNSKNINMSSFYEEAFFNDVQNARYITNKSKWGGGGFYGTSDDVTNFALDLLNNRIFIEPYLNKMFEPMLLSDGTKTNYGFGMFVGTRDVNTDTYGAHSGSGIGGRSAIILLKKEKLVLTMLSNIEGESFLKVLDQIKEIFRTKSKLIVK